MRPKLKRLLSIAALSTSFLISTCKDTGEPVRVALTGGFGLIVPGEGMEGIRLGDSKETVLAKLGPPTAVGFLDGIYTSWRTLDYFDGPHAGLSILFLEAENGDYGPVDGVQAGTPSGPQYEGKTKEGIGRWASLSLVRQVYGPPDTTLVLETGAWITDYYCISNKQFLVHYQDSVVTTLFIGYYRPVPRDRLYRCR